MMELYNFDCKYNDPSGVKIMKKEMENAIINIDTIKETIGEFDLYANEDAFKVNFLHYSYSGVMNYVSGWKYLTDDEINDQRNPNIFTPLSAPSLISYAATIDGSDLPLEVISAEIIKHLDEGEGHPQIIGARSQHGNSKKLTPKKCFKSCVMFEIVENNLKYNLRYFPKNGKANVTGVVNEDFSDGRRIIDILLEFLKVVLKTEFHKLSEGIVLMNHNFKIIKPCPRSLINVVGIFREFKDNPLFLFPKGIPVLNEITFRLAFDQRFCISVKMHLEGHVTISSKSIDHAKFAYEYLRGEFNTKWNLLMGMTPRTYSEESLRADVMKKIDKKYADNYAMIHDMLIKIIRVNNA